MLIKENRNYVILEAFDVTVKMCINKKCPDYAAEHETKRRTCAECGSKLVDSDQYYRRHAKYGKKKERTCQGCGSVVKRGSVCPGCGGMIFAAE